MQEVRGFQPVILSGGGKRYERLTGDKSSLYKHILYKKVVKEAFIVSPFIQRQ